MKFSVHNARNIAKGRSPHGECGLKSVVSGSFVIGDESLPAWGVWIEIVPDFLNTSVPLVAPRMGSVD